MLFIVLTVIAIIVGGYLAISALYDGGDSLENNIDRVNYNTMVNGATQVATASHQYMLENGGKMPTDAELNGRTLAEFYKEETDYLKSVPKGVSQLANGNDSNIWQYNGYITHLVNDDQKCANINGFAGGSNKVEDIPSCSLDFDPYNPCCMD